MRLLEISLVFYFGGFNFAPTREQTIKYMKGWCPYFALAVHDVFGYSIFFSTPNHFLNVHDKKYIDIRGIMTEKQVSNGIISENFITISRQELIDEINTGDYKCGFFNKKDLNSAKNLVKKLMK
jgi:hypothetical protein